LSLHTFLRESTWGYPIISAIHGLGIAWFGGTILIASFGPELRTLRRIAIGLLLLSGGVLFWLQPEQYYTSVSFWLKMLMLAPALLVRPASKVSMAFWIAIIFASRGIAFL
jgi:hypothetical protein